MSSQILQEKQSLESEEVGVVPGSPIKIRHRLEAYVKNMLISQDFISGNLMKMPDMDILLAINESLRREDNPVNKISEFWQDFLYNKYYRIPPYIKTWRQFKHDLKQDIRFIKQFMMKVVFNIYRDWVEYKPIEQHDVMYRILPDLITKGQRWKLFLQNLKDRFGFLRVAFNRDSVVKDPTFFGINQFKHQAYNKTPTLELLKSYIEQSNIMKKYQMANEIHEQLLKQMQANLDKYCLTNPSLKSKQIGYDDKVQFLEYTILQLNHNIGIHLYLQSLFYPHEFMHQLYDNQVVEFMEVAYDRLTKRNKNAVQAVKCQQDEQQSPKQIQMSLDMGNSIKASSITFDSNSLFAYCFKFHSYKKIEANSHTLVSILSYSPLKDGHLVKFTVSGNDVLIGVFRKPEGRNRSLVKLPGSVTICLKNGRIFRDGKTKQLQNSKVLKDVKEIYMGLYQSTLLWQLTPFGEYLAEEDISGLLANKSSVYLHVCLSNGASVQVH